MEVIKELPKGFKANGYKDGYGFSIIISEKKAIASGVFTRNKVKAYPVIYSKDLLEKKKEFKAIIANSGNAICLIKDGFETVNRIIEKASELFNLNKEDILIASTGVIGRKLDFGMLEERMIKVKELLENGNSIVNAAKGIMTTDKFPKYVAVKIGDVRVCGIAKGAGMINPNMATMLCFILTDIKIDKEDLDKLLKDIVDKTFNNISVDGDTSTNDTVFILANGESGVDYKNCKEDFYKALLFVCRELAKMIVKDGEGATKFLELTIKNAKSREDAKKAGKAIINSLLVKTALFGGDPNWGRIIAALGYSGAEFKDVDLILSNGNEEIYLMRNGIGEDSGDILKKAENIMKGKEIKIIVDLKVGDVDETFYGCDLSYEYVKINAEYTT
ncbi:bifunctional ornithine acetyltransferase/N-acetylglutamate synthase protein [Methanocaldococcus villosus KIN24-T80]|uniref:Glutamate N-acetyltransferase n=1 Tax=Methanocaldococcus villosus KIN24-T80 TaxID=1069083 RepID=N6VX58_9EURY|nr:bifunctional ornithine acetyltransferase/N-acetylglutamate synthase [Methanocaldococcus villosus]ENN95697.1 bifunctional ornithine acetyltransferase/N-acetylglutamate synthase protein [Methanocaldococcus villosus KIN24-T80]